MGSSLDNVSRDVGRHDKTKATVPVGENRRSHGQACNTQTHTIPVCPWNGTKTQTRPVLHAGCDSCPPAS